MFVSGWVTLQFAWRGMRRENVKGNCLLMVEQKGLSQSVAACSPFGSVNSHITSVAWFLENEGEMGKDQEKQRHWFYKSICYGKLFSILLLWVIC